MSTNVTFLGDIADWYDRQTNRLIELRNGVFRWADPRGYSGHNTLRSPLGLWAAWGDGLIHMSQGFVDTLRIGNGVRDARTSGVSASGAWGAAQDVFRLANVFGWGRVIGRVPRVMQMVVQSPGSVVCRWVSTINALERTGHNFWISIRDLMTSVGLSESAIISAGGTTPAMVRRLIDTLRAFRVPVEELGVAVHQTGWEALQGHAMIRRRGVFIVSITFARQAANAGQSLASRAHAIIATFSREYGLLFQDTNGRIYAGIDALRRVYPEATIARHNPIVFIHDSAMVTRAALTSGTAETMRAAAAESSEGSSLMENIVLPAIAIVSQSLNRE